VDDETKKVILKMRDDIDLVKKIIFGAVVFAIAAFVFR
jgi:hypothetical protein